MTSSVITDHFPERPDASASAYLTVFLSLSLTIILSLFLTLIEGSRQGMIRMQAELVTDVAMESVLAEYNTKLLEQYDLLFVDTTYGGTSSPGENLLNHLRTYYTGNFESRTRGIGSVQSFTSISLSELELTGWRFAGDDGCQALAEGIQAYMTADASGGIIAGAESLLSTFGRTGIDMEDEGSWRGLWEKENSTQYRKKDEAISKEITAREAAARQEAEENGTPEEIPEVEIHIDDPAEEVNAFRQSPILSQVLDAGAEISDTAVNAGALFSGRGSNQTGGGNTKPGSSHHYEEVGNLLFAAYVLEKCGCYTEKKEGSELSYEVEYLLEGKSSDKENLEKTAGKLLALRTALNFIFLEQNAERKGTARTFVMAIPGVTAVPGLTEVLTVIALLAWSYVESVKDVKTLLAGKKVPVMKTDSTWSTDLEDIRRPGSITADEGSEEGVSYKDYLKFFVWAGYAGDAGGMRKRLLDVIEMDIRKTKNNENFRIDKCLDTFGIRVKFSSAFGYTCSVERTVTYN